MAESPVNRVLRPIYELGMIMTALREAKIICTLAWPSCIANLTFLSSMAVMAVRAPSHAAPASAPPLRLLTAAPRCSSWASSARMRWRARASVSCG